MSGEEKAEITEQQRTKHAVRFEIVKKRKLAERIWQMDVRAPRVASKCQPGQFLIVRIDDRGERIPLTICDYDRTAGTVTIVFQETGVTTVRMKELEEGDAFADFTGPLGRPSELTEKTQAELMQKKILFVAGGVGTAPVYPQVKYLHELGIRADVIIGGRSADILILEEEMREVAGEVFIATDDGSRGLHGNVTAAIRKLVCEDGKHYDLCVAIGPVVMMKFTSLTTKELGIPTVVSMNPIMVDGTGMCGACRIPVGGEVKFACVDGPEFDGHLVDFDAAIKRQQLYKTEEGRAMLAYTEGKTHHGGCGNCGGEKR